MHLGYAGSVLVIIPTSVSCFVADDMDDVADRVPLGGKDTVSICLITGFESFNISLYNKVP